MWFIFAFSNSVMCFGVDDIWRVNVVGCGLGRRVDDVEDVVIFLVNGCRIGRLALYAIDGEIKRVASNILYKDIIEIQLKLYILQ